MKENNQTVSKDKKHSIAKNYFYNVIYQVFILIVPLITTPYISRVLSANGVGQYSFSNSLCSYFILVAALGFGYYAQREIANNQNNKKEQSIIFWEIIVVRFFSVSIALMINIILFFCGAYGNYSILMLWWSLAIIAVEFDISFLFQGNEEFKKIVGRNIFIKTISVLLIFLLVKNTNDVWIYVVCTSASTLFGNLSLWLFLPKYLRKVSIHELRPQKHILPTLKLFIPTIATSIYTVLDKTLIGFLVEGTYEVSETIVENGVEKTIVLIQKYSDLENGYYEQSEKIIKMCMAIITSLGTVMIPRNSKLYSENNEIMLKKNFYFSTNYVWFLGIPIMLGLIACAPNIIPWFLGDGFGKCIGLMQLFAPLVLLIGFSNVFGLQYLVPTKRDGKFTIGILAGTVSNLILNLILIKFFWSYGAVIASLIAEFLVTLVMYFMIRKEISIKQILTQSIKPIIAGCIMFLIVYFTQKYLIPKWYYSVLLVIEGIIVYTLFMYILRDQFLMKLIHDISLKFKNK